MARIIVEEDCGNAPRKSLLRDFYAAASNGDEAAVRAYLSPGVTLVLVGEKVVSGVDDVTGAILRPPGDPTEVLVIENIITHGDSASVNGTASLKSGVTYGFCDVYKFAGFVKTAKIKSITSYVIRTGG